MQRELTIASLVNFPLSLFGAYHYDPRRHLLGEEGYDIDSMTKSIIDNHAFFLAKFDKNSKQSLHNEVEYEGAVLVTPHNQLNNESNIKRNHRHPWYCRD